MEPNLFDNLKAMLIKYRLQFFKGFVMLLISNALLIINPLVFRQAILAVVPETQDSAPLLHLPLFVWGIILISIAAISAFFKYHMRIAFITVSREVERNVRLRIFERIQAQSRDFFDRFGVGELLSRLTNDISSYRDVLGPGVLYPLLSLSLIVPGLAALFYISPHLATLSLIPLAVIPLINAALRKQIFKVSLLLQKALGVMSNMAQEYFSGIRIIKAYVVESKTYDHFTKLCRELISISIRYNCYQGLLVPFFTLLTKLVTIALVFVSGYIILNAWGELNVADFLSFMWIQSYIFFPILMLSWIIPVYERGRASYNRLVEIYNEPIEVREGLYANLHIPPHADISLNHLTFAYPRSSRQVLSNINLKIEPGTFVGITGPVGAGKSTLFKLLNREYEIPDGMISIAGHDIHDYPLSAFSQAMITVDQVPFLFSKSIAENVRFGHEQASRADVELVARYADLHETVLEFPDQYETVVGERGVKLSGGQKQRVAMARAFLVNRSILLLDDIFSAVDVATEKRIFSAMKKNFKDKTVLLISHRVTILEQMDRVIYMKNGQIEEDGTPQALALKGGYYSALTELQQLEKGYDEKA